MKKKLDIKKFYGYFSSGASFFSEEKKFFGKKNIRKSNKEILYNCKRLRLNNDKLSGKIIMNVGSGREALGFLQFNPKKIYHYDISRKNILNFKKFIKLNKLSNKIISKKLDLSRDHLPQNKFDLVYLHGVIQHVDYIDKAMINISNSIKKNGTLWFCFYRPGSLLVLLGSMQRFLLKNINIKNFYKKLMKKKYSFQFKDGIMDDCFVPNRQLFYPKDYMRNLKKLNLKIFGDSFIINTVQKYNFNKFHSSVVVFLKKTSNQKILLKFGNFLKQRDVVDVLDIKIYKKDKRISEIIRILQQNQPLQTDKIFNKVVMIEKLKNNISNTYLKKKMLNKKYVINILNILEKIIKK